MRRADRLRGSALAQTRRRFGAAALALLGAVAAPASAQGVGAPPPPIEQGLMDCSLYRYGDALDDAVDTTLHRIEAASDSHPVLGAALKATSRRDVTETLVQLRMIQRVPGCLGPVVRGFAGHGRVELELSALQQSVCERLLSSEKLRLSGMLVQPLHAPSGEQRCGVARNLVPGLFTLGRLTQAGRSMPGENTVTVVSRGPFGAKPQVLARPQPPDSCPRIDGRRDPVVESMRATHTVVSHDYPRSWQPARCFDSLGGTSSVGLVCPVAEWNHYHERLYAEFERMAAAGEAPHDPQRIFSAAWWLIERSDPLRLTIKSFDYAGRECDVIRNRIVVAWGKCMSDEVESLLKAAAFDAAKLGRAQIKDKLLESVLPCVGKSKSHYDAANQRIDDFLRPPPFPEERMRVLDRMQKRVRAAMASAGFGDCRYYADAVHRIDEIVWADHYRNGPPALPVDWEHNFWKSAAVCLAGR